MVFTESSTFFIEKVPKKGRKRNYLDRNSNYLKRNSNFL